MRTSNARVSIPLVNRLGLVLEEPEVGKNLGMIQARPLRFVAHLRRRVPVVTVGGFAAVYQGGGESSTACSMYKPRNPVVETEDGSEGG